MRKPGLCWALERRGLFSSHSVHSCSLSPVVSHQLHLCSGFAGQDPCLYAVAHHDMHENWGMTAGHARVVGFLLFCPVSFLGVDENHGCVLWQWTKTSRRLPDPGYVHLFPITSGKLNRRAEGVGRMSVCCQVPRDLEKAVEPALQCHLRVGGRGAHAPWMKMTVWMGIDITEDWPECKNFILQ